MTNFVSAFYRASDEETRSYSLRERLGAGKFIFEEHSGKEKRKIKSWSRAWKDARSIVFKNHPYVSWLKKKGPELTFLGNDKEKSLKEASYWNPFAWLEVITLSWVNWATLRYDPLHEKGLRVAGSYLHIMLAGLMYAAAKTANLVLSPIAPILFIAAIMTVGLLNPWVLSILCVAGAAFIGSMIFHGNQNAEARDEDDRVPEHKLYGLVHAVTSVVLGIISPFIHLRNKAKALWETHPKLAIAAGITAFTLVLAIAVFPYVSIPAIAGFQFGTYAATAMAPLLNGFGALLSTMGPTVTAMLSITTVTAATIGAVDLTVRAFKEIAGWWDKGRAKEAVADWVEDEHSAVTSPSHAHYLQYSNGIGRISPSLIEKNAKKVNTTQQPLLVGYIEQVTNKKYAEINANVYRWINNP